MTTAVVHPATGAGSSWRNHRGFQPRPDAAGGIVPEPVAGVHRYIRGWRQGNSARHAGYQSGYNCAAAGTDNAFLPPARYCQNRKARYRRWRAAASIYHSQKDRQSAHAHPASLMRKRHRTADYRSADSVSAYRVAGHVHCFYRR